MALIPKIWFSFSMAQRYKKTILILDLDGFRFKKYFEIN
jgi:hypothetical protein